MGAFLLFAWPPLTGSIILGYLLAFLVVRLGATSTRFFLAPTAERLRLVPVCTETAWFWHRWVARLVGTAAIGWQTLLTLRTLGMSQPGLDVLLQLLLLLLAGLGIWIVWTMPTVSGATAQRLRGPVPRLVMSLALVLDWLLFLMGATALGWTLLILAAVPAAIYILGSSASFVILGRWEDAGDDRSAHLAIAGRAIQTLVVLLAAAAMVHVWQIDLTRMTNMDTPMTRIARGLLEALVILVIADLLWQVVRVLIDTRLAGDAPAIDNLDDDALRRRARLRTLLPVLRNFAFFIVLVMASLSALAAMGLQIGPLLAGAGVVGIAVGFGAQTLVRDILSGVFFLLDDAFRVGEYIESGGIRGTVESFSLRSVKLRHLNGQLHTVPFGDLKAITNYSRDWVVEIAPRRDDLRHRSGSPGKRRGDGERRADGRSCDGPGDDRTAEVARRAGDDRHRHADRVDVQDAPRSPVCRAPRRVRPDQVGVRGARHSLRDRAGATGGQRRVGGGCLRLPERQLSATSKPRFVPGRAIIVSYQRLTLGKSARSTLWRSCRQAQPRMAKSAIDTGPPANSTCDRRLSSTPYRRRVSFDVTLEAVATVLLVLHLQEVMHLAGHRPEAAHLPHQPFQHRNLGAQIGRIEFSGLHAEIDQDRA